MAHSLCQTCSIYWWHTICAKRSVSSDGTQFVPKTQCLMLAHSLCKIWSVQWFHAVRAKHSLYHYGTLCAKCAFIIVAHCAKYAMSNYDTQFVPNVHCVMAPFVPNLHCIIVARCAKYAMSNYDTQFVPNIPSVTQNKTCCWRKQGSYYQFAGIVGWRHRLLRCCTV